MNIATSTGSSRSVKFWRSLRQATADRFGNKRTPPCVVPAPGAMRTRYRKSKRVWNTHRRLYGADTVCHPLNREGIVVARCTVERLLKQRGLQGARRGKVVRTTVPDMARGRVRRTRSIANSWQSVPIRGGSVTSPMSAPGRAFCLSPLSLTSLPGTSSAGESAATGVPTSFWMHLSTGVV